MSTRYEGLTLIRHLCDAFGPSGCEDGVRRLIEEQLADLTGIQTVTDRLGNLIVRLPAPNGSANRDTRIMLSAHMDEVGFMVTAITDEGYLKFDTVGGISPRVLCGRNVTVGDGETQAEGIIASKAIHHKPRSKRLDITPITSLYMDIGATSKAEASRAAEIGTYATFSSPFVCFGQDDKFIKAKALDDRLGCALLIELARALSQSPPDNAPDVYLCFTVREEIGISGAAVAAQSVRPDFAIVLETTAVGDVPDADASARVASLGEGGVISLMDRSTIYDRDFIRFAMDTAKRHGIKAQIKKYVSGGNDAAHIHKSGVGVRTLALSAPTRYLHSPACVAHCDDYTAMLDLLLTMLGTWSYGKEPLC